MDTRDRLIELIDAAPTLDTMYGEFEELQEAADYLIANGVTVGDANNATTTWISVEDRLPEQGGIYLTYTKEGYISLGIYFAASNDFEPCNVTHWQPLPQAPKGVE